MLTAPAVAPTAPTFEPTSNTFRFPQQQPRLQQQQQNPYQTSSNSAASMSYSHGRGGMSFSSNSSRGGTGANGRIYHQQQANYNNSIPASNTVMSNGMTEASSSSTINAQTVANNARRNRRPDTEELKQVGRVHYQELFHFLRSHLAKGEY